MPWPFSKRKPSLQIPPEDEQFWTVAEGDYGGEHLIVRANATAKRLIGHSRLPVKLGFAIPLNQPRSGGVPEPSENEVLQAVEELIASRVLAAGAGIHAMTLTTGAMKEFVFYVAPGLDIEGLHAGLREDVSSHEVHCVACSEPDWASYRSFVR